MSDAALWKWLLAEQISFTKTLRSGSHTFAQRTSGPACLVQSGPEEEESVAQGLGTSDLDFRKFPGDVCTTGAKSLQSHPTLEPYTL